MSGSVRRHHAKQREVRAARVAAFKAGQPAPEVGYALPQAAPTQQASAPVTVEPALDEPKAPKKRRAHQSEA